MLRLVTFKQSLSSKLPHTPILCSRKSYASFPQQNTLRPMMRSLNHSEKKLLFQDYDDYIALKRYSKQTEETLQDLQGRLTLLEVKIGKKTSDSDGLECILIMIGVPCVVYFVACLVILIFTMVGDHLAR